MGALDAKGGGESLDWLVVRTSIDSGKALVCGKSVSGKGAGSFEMREFGMDAWMDEEVRKILSLAGPGDRLTMSVEGKVLVGVKLCLMQDGVQAGMLEAGRQERIQRLDFPKIEDLAHVDSSQTKLVESDVLSKWRSEAEKAREPTLGQWADAVEVAIKAIERLDLCSRFVATGNLAEEQAAGWAVQECAKRMSELDPIAVGLGAEIMRRGLLAMSEEEHAQKAFRQIYEKMAPILGPVAKSRLYEGLVGSRLDVAPSKAGSSKRAP